MKLRNKKTGEIGYLIADRGSDYYVVDKHGYNNCGNKYNSLAELNAEWEDYEEPKEYWFINSVAGVIQPSDTTDWEQQDATHHKEIGNYFETKEEAEKAVEKLKAWKRLKDKGFKFDRWNNASSGPYRPIWFYFEKDTALEDIESDLDLLFRGEE